jgi:heparan sulfate 6-O-sulfotransferase HS6ST1
MEIKRIHHFKLFKKLIIYLIFFCLTLNIVLNYICNESICYWKLNRYNYVESQSYRDVFNEAKDKNYQKKDKFNHILDKNYKIKNKNDQTKYYHLKNGLTHQNTQLNLKDNELNKSDQLISLKKKTRLINLIDQSNELNLRLKYLNLINHSSINQSFLNLYQVSYDQIHSENVDFKFNLYKNDVLIFLHIQKTGGTSFGIRLVHDLLLDKPCECFENRKHCSCLRPTLKNKFNELKNQTTKLINFTQKKNNTTIENDEIKSKFWLFSRYSTGWVCGLHADWTQLNWCVNDALNRLEKVKLKRRYFFITILREPISRFLSEYDHVRRGATWRTSRYACSIEFLENKFELNDELKKFNLDGIQNKSLSLNKCYSGNDWKNVKLNDYINCNVNLAINRQTRMLADLSKVGCFNNEMKNRTEYEKMLLESAIYNLNRLAFYGILEYQNISQFVFESTFNFKFKHSFIQLNRTHSTQIKITNQTLELIKKLNYLDIQLYDYAKKLFFKRFEIIKKSRSYEKFKKSKLDSLSNPEMNLNQFPEFKLIRKFSRFDKSNEKNSD